MKGERSQRGRMRAANRVVNGKQYAEYVIKKQALELIRLDRREPVEARADLLYCSSRDEPLQIGERNPKGLDVTRPEEGSEAPFPQACRGEGWCWHRRTIINVGTYNQVPTFIFI